MVRSRTSLFNIEKMGSLSTFVKKYTLISGQVILETPEGIDYLQLVGDRLAWMIDDVFL